MAVPRSKRLGLNIHPEKVTIKAKVYCFFVFFLFLACFVIGVVVCFMRFISLPIISFSRSFPLFSLPPSLSKNREHPTQQPKLLVKDLSG